MTVHTLESSAGAVEYIKREGEGVASIFYMPGHRNSFESRTTKTVHSVCERNNLPMLSMRYSRWEVPDSRTPTENREHHFKIWLQQACELIDQTTGPQAIVGYSMGSYIALSLAALRPKRVKNIICVAPGVKTTVFTIDDSHCFIRTMEGKKVLHLRGKPDGSVGVSNLKIKCPVYLGHSMTDDAVSYRNNFHLARAISSENVHIYLSKGGNHRFDRPNERYWLEKQMITNCRTLDY